MIYLKLFEDYSESMYSSLTDDESKYYLNWKKEKITQTEFERLKSIQEKYYKSDEHIIKYDENRTHYTFIKYDNQFKTVTLPIEITKIGDDWWVVTYVSNRGAFPDDCNYLCDTIDGVEEWFKENL